MTKQHYNKVGIKTIGETIGTLYFDKQSLGDAIARMQGGESYIRITSSHEELGRKTLDKVVELEVTKRHTSEYLIVDLRSLTGTYHLANTWNIDRPMTILLGEVTLFNKTNDGEGPYDLISVNSNNVCIIGKKGNSINNGTILKMVGDTTNSEDKGYHITVRGDNAYISNITLLGKRTTFGHQYESINYPIDGLGGVRLQEHVHNVELDGLAIKDTKAHGIFGKSLSHITISNSIFESIAGHGIVIEDSIDVKMDNNSIMSTEYIGIYCKNSKNTAIRNNVFYNVPVGISIVKSVNTLIENNTLDSLVKFGGYIKGIGDTGMYGVNIPEVEDITNSDFSLYVTPKGVVSLDSVNVKILNLMSGLISITDVEDVTTTHIIKLYNSVNVRISSLFTKFLNALVPKHEVSVDNTNSNVIIEWDVSAATNNIYETADINIPAALYYNIPEYETNNYDYFDIMTFKPTKDRDIIVGDNKVGFIPEIVDCSTVQIGENSTLYTLG